ncbi:MAG: helix-turn-helix transcriptional regulator, partial [Nitriliruptoraceae bacterium]
MGRSEDYGRRESPTWVSEAGLPSALLALRERDGRTQKEVAADAGVSPATIARLESGDRRPSRKVLFQLAHAYRVTPEQLLKAAERIDAGEEPAKVLATLGTGSGADAARAAPAPAAATAADTAGDYAPPVWQQDDLER